MEKLKKTKTVKKPGRDEGASLDYNHNHHYHHQHHPIHPPQQHSNCNTSANNNNNSRDINNSSSSHNNNNSSSNLGGSKKQLSGHHAFVKDFINKYLSQNGDECAVDDSNANNNADTPSMAKAHSGDLTNMKNFGSEMGSRIKNQHYQAGRGGSTQVQQDIGSRTSGVQADKWGRMGLLKQAANAWNGLSEQDKSIWMSQSHQQAQLLQHHHQRHSRHHEPTIASDQASWFDIEDEDDDDVDDEHNDKFVEVTEKSPLEPSTMHQTDGHPSKDSQKTTGKHGMTKPGKKPRSKSHRRLAKSARKRSCVSKHARLNVKRSTVGSRRRMASKKVLARSRRKIQAANSQLRKKTNSTNYGRCVAGFERIKPAVRFSEVKNSEKATRKANGNHQGKSRSGNASCNRNSRIRKTRKTAAGSRRKKEKSSKAWKPRILDDDEEDLDGDDDDDDKDDNNTNVNNNTSKPDAVVSFPKFYRGREPASSRFKLLN